MDFALLPPEINSGRMYVGPGSGPTLAAAAAWDGLASELQLAAASYGSVVSALSAGPWLGPASAAMAAAAGPQVVWMSATATQAEQAATQAKAAAAAYEAAFAATVPPTVIAANRALLTALVATNAFGQNTPAIAATETQYAEMWAQDAAAMYGYAGASASATTLAPFAPPAQRTGSTGLSNQAAAIAQVSGTSAVSKTQTALAQLASAVPDALQGLASPGTSTSAAVSPAGIVDLLQSLGLISPSTFFEPAALGLGSSELSTASGAWASAAQGDEEILTAGHQIVADTGEINGLKLEMMTRFDQLGATGPTGSAGVGEAASVGALSVPQGWAAAAPQMRLAALALPATGLGAAPEVFAVSPGALFGEMTMATMAGQAMSGTARPVSRERVGELVRARRGIRGDARADGAARQTRFAARLGDPDPRRVRRAETAPTRIRSGA